MDHNPIPKILRWIWDTPKKDVLLAALQWCVFMWRYIRATFLIRRQMTEEQASVRQRRRAYLRKLAQRYGMPIKRILALDALKRAHVGASFMRFAQGLLLDRLALITAGSLGALAIFNLSDGWMAATLFAAVALLTVWSWVRLEKTRPIHDVQPLLGRLARRIGKITGAEVVVFGHTHQPAIERRGGVQWMNPGSWEHLPWAGAHGEHDECTCAVRYGVVTGHGSETEVYLVDWCSLRHEPLGAREAAGRTLRLPSFNLPKGVGSLHARLDQILGSLRNGGGHVTTLGNQAQVTESKV